MGRPSIGISIQGFSPAHTLEMIVRAESLGVPAVWLPGATPEDALTLFAAAAVSTQTIKFGTAIVPTFPRHPLVMVQQAEVIANLAPGRLMLGVGPGHKPRQEPVYGIPFERPLEHLREYVAIVKAALRSGTVDFDGVRFHVHAAVPYPAMVPVMISALRAASFRLAGEIADGAITWVCPAPYLREMALPALREGAAKAGRPVPPLVAHAFIAVTEDLSAFEATVRRRVRIYEQLPNYIAMFESAGYPEARSGKWSERMIESVIIHGDEGKVSAGLRDFLEISGADQLIASVIPVGADSQASIHRSMRLIGLLANRDETQG